jgi:hypothetical protein
MITIDDRASMARVLTLDLDRHLRDLLERRFASLVTIHGDLTDWTEFLIVQPGDSEDDIIQEVGFSPMVEPIDGARFGSKGFQPFWDHLTDHGGWFELTISFGSAFAYVLFIQDADGVLRELRRLCRRYCS